MERTAKVASAVVLIAVAIGAIASQPEMLRDNLIAFGPVTLLLCLASLTVGYCVPRILGAIARNPPRAR